MGVSIPIGSVEGFVQGLKISNPAQQKEAFLLSGKEAKRAAKDVEVNPDGAIFFTASSLSVALSFIAP